jgi:hypothetical protein
MVYVWCVGRRRQVVVVSVGASIFLHCVLHQLQQLVSDAYVRVRRTI